MNYTYLIFDNMRLHVNLETKQVRALLDDGQALNAIQWANVSESMFKDRFNKEKCRDYERFTTFFFDLSIAEYYGNDAIEETYDSVVKSWLSDYKYFAEFVLCLNWKILSWYGLGCKDVGLIYDKLWKKADALIWERYGKDEEASSYIFNILD